MIRYTALLAMLLTVVGTASATVTRYPVHRVPTPPVIDGEVAQDPAWTLVPEATGFHVLGGGYTSAKQSTARICWDEEALYVGFVAEEPDAALLKPTTRDGGAPWGEDSIEVFLQPRPPSGQTYQLGVTAGGGQGSGEGHPDITQTTAAARIGQSSYSIELRVPWAVVAARPQTGDKWRGTVCRNIFTTQSGGDKFTSLSPLQRQFLEPANFAELVFTDQVLDAAGAARLTGELNAPYHRTLQQQVRELAAQRSEYEETLRSAVGDPTYGREASALLQRWEALAALAARLAQASTAEIRQSLAASRDLGKQSHELKYRVLLKQLLLD
ncbi:MAG: carbohydrate-binding family 9-like protein [Armatimonadetes bacterium]|nr:carbohydrate-binding family 9-like protein [Armatimonadota bacterium]